VGSVFVIVANEVGKKALQVALIDRDDVVQQVAPTTLDPPLRDPVLPRTPERGSNRPDSHRANRDRNLQPILAILIEDEKPGSRLIPEAGVRRRAERLYQQLDVLRSLRQDARQELLAESRKHPAIRLLCQIPCIGPIRAALLIALIQTPHRFRTKRQLWAYSGLALATWTSAEYRFLNGQLQRSKKLLATRGLNANHNHDLKNIFKGAATLASVTAGPFQDFYLTLLAKGMKASMARLTLARKIAAITLIVWKKGVGFDAEHLKQQAA
jgi:hypothetical protein